MRYWYKADDNTSTGTTWYDSSINNANASTIVGTPQFSGSLNFNPTYYLDGSSSFVASGAADFIGDYSIFGVSRLLGTQNARVFSNELVNDIFGDHG